MKNPISTGKISIKDLDHREVPQLDIKEQTESRILVKEISSSERTRTREVFDSITNSNVMKPCGRHLLFSQRAFKTLSENKNEITGNRISSTYGNIAAYKIGSEIGRGLYSVVSKCVHYTDPDKIYAVKMYDKHNSFTARKKRGIKHEIQILKKLQDKHIIQLFESIEDSNYFYLIFECVKGGSLVDYLNSCPMKKLNEEEAKRIFKQIVEAIQYCHQQNVVHRDLKLDNILLDENRNVKIIDFGFSVVVNSICKLNLFCGTSCYMAPEIVNHQDYWGPPVDIWCLGIILYSMLTGKLPFKGCCEKEIYKSIIRGVYIIPMDMSQSAGELISRLLCADPAKRPTCDEIMKDPFLCSGFSSIDNNEL